jgi:hypothetical protein
MSERQVPTAVAQRIIIRFLVGEDVKNTDIFVRLQKQFGSECLSRAGVFKWAKIFKDGHKTVENEPHDRRPRTSVTPDNIRRVEQLILACCTSISCALNVPLMLYTTLTF